jgi:hypothetical protein
MSLSLYQIDKAIQDLLDAGFNYTVDEETGELIYDDRSAELEQLQMDRASKLEAVALYIKNLVALAEDIKAEEKALEERRKAHEKKAENLRRYLGNSLTAAQEEGFETAKVQVSFSKSSAVIANMDLLDKAFIKESVKTEYSPDKKAIRAAIKAGQAVPGAYIEERKKVKIQ